MKSLSQTINESSKDTSIISMFKDGEDSMLSMIAKRIENWDANNKKHSREPMFLCDINRKNMMWSRVDTMNIETSGGKKDWEYYDGFLKEYYSGETTKLDQYILGIFIDGYFIPIPDKETFDKIWNKLNK